MSRWKVLALLLMIVVGASVEAWLFLRLTELYLGR